MSNRKLASVSVRDLGVLGYSTMALWSYATDAPLSAVLAPGYFSGATEEFKSPEWARGGSYRRAIGS